MYVFFSTNTFRTNQFTEGRIFHPKHQLWTGCGTETLSEEQDHLLAKPCSPAAAKQTAPGRGGAQRN